MAGSMAGREAGPQGPALRLLAEASPIELEDALPRPLGLGAVGAFPAGMEEAVPRAGEDLGGVGLPGLLHRRRHLGKRAGDPSIVLTIDPEHRRADALHGRGVRWRP